MNDNSPSRNLQPPRRTFGAEESAVDGEEDSPSRTGNLLSSRRPSGRVSFNTQVQHKPSFIGRWRRGSAADEEGAGGMNSPKPDLPPIPSALQPPPEACATPLPALSMIVLSITMLGEFLSANVSTPFLLFMVEGFHQFRDEADVGYWTGLLVSTFFLTQFLTSLLWATVAAKHGTRVVVFISLLGSSVTCVLFGTSKSIQQAMVVRLMQGVFAGAIGVARGSVPAVTDQTNEGRAYAILGFCWGFGGVSGAIVGGTFESPAQKWPGVFAKVPLLVEYPYLLPCAVAASVTFTGSMLSLFLGPDCGPREGAIRLVPEKATDQVSVIDEESLPTSPFDAEPSSGGLYGSLRKKVSKKLSGYFTRDGFDTQEGSPSPSAPQTQAVPLVPSRPDRARSFSRTSRANGSAYGYGVGYRNRLASNASLGMRRGSMPMSLRRRRESNVDGLPSSVATGSDLNFAQRLLMANENAVSNIADLWVAAAINADNEDPFESDSETDADDEEVIAEDADELGERDEISTTPRVNRFTRRVSSATSRAARPSYTGHRPPNIGGPSTPQRRFSSTTHLASAALSPGEISPTPRRLSSTVPSIFHHAGVRTPPAVLEAQQLLDIGDQFDDAAFDNLAPIMENQRLSRATGTQPEVPEKEPSLMSQLPILIIIQYGLLALHSTTHDQIFYLYLVSKYPSGGLNLNAGHFSQLIALMCLAQIAYQFYLYPNIGPPRGRFSHLAMFRIGSLLFIPAYLSVTLYRVFAGATDDGNPILMAALALSTAVRFCGMTFSYTAISVLLNYMSPPHVVGYANGIAQSIVSLARFCGPVLGGLLWSVSVQDNPAGYPLGFLVCAAACSLAVAQSMFIR